MKFIKKIRYLVYWLRYLKDFIYDLNRFVSFSNIEHIHITDSEKLIAKIISLYHVIEKGLSMENPRPGFGLPRVFKLIEYIELYDKRFDKSEWDIQVKSAIKVLDEYRQFNEVNFINIDEVNIFLSKHIDILESDKFDGGTKVFNSNYLLKNEGISFDEVINMRSSIRNFGDDKISFSVVKKSIMQAQNAPSTCNRQSSRVLFSNNPNLIMKLLELQGGANGFSDKISSLLIICSDMKCYQGGGDRHSGIIDASLYAMALMYCLSKNGVANISLNWSKTAKEDRALRKMIDFPESYHVLFFIGLGSYRNSIKVPISTKNTLDKILHEIKE